MSEILIKPSLSIKPPVTISSARSKLPSKSKYLVLAEVGSGLLVSTPQCLHKAGIPKKNYHRDMLFLIFCAYPNKDKNIFYYEGEKDNPDWKQLFIRELSKPHEDIKAIHLSCMNQILLNWKVILKLTLLFLMEMMN